MNNHKHLESIEILEPEYVRTHIHWLIWAYTKKTPNETGGYMYHNNVAIDVIASSYKEALERAMLFMPLGPRYAITENNRDAGYDVMSVIEHLEGQCTHGDAH